MSAVPHLLGARVLATFAPRRLETLRPGFERWVGYRGEWYYAWKIDEESGGPYVGQAAMLPWYDPHATPRDQIPCDGLWVPEEDLSDVEVVHPGVPDE